MPRITFRLEDKDLEFVKELEKASKFKRSEVVRFAIQFLRLNVKVGMFGRLNPDDISDMMAGMLAREETEKETTPQSSSRT